MSDFKLKEYLQVGDTLSVLFFFSNLFPSPATLLSDSCFSVVSLLPCPCHCVVLLSYVPSCGCLSTGYVCSTPFIVFAFIFILFTILQRDPQNTSSAFQWVPPFFVVHDISTISFYIVLSNIRSCLLL